MFIYSGECKLCKTGLQTKLTDDFGNSLRTGDIVLSYTVTRDTGMVHIGSLTVVVAKHYMNYHGQLPSELPDEEKSKPYIMGIKDCDVQEPIEDYPTEVWRVHKVKSYKDVMEGENWKDFGFNYREL